MHAAGTNQFTSEGTNKAKNLPVCTLPSCHTINVVMSPKGENAPPAFAAITMLVHARLMNHAWPRPTDIATAPIRRAVVMLSATG